MRNTDVLIVGSGCSGLYCALHLPEHQHITLITKSDLESSDSFLAQGGICTLKDPSDYDAFLEDTLKAGHFENDRESVSLMIRSSPQITEDLLSYGVRFQREADGSLAYTREGAHSQNRILFHKDITGREITEKLLEQVKQKTNVTLLEYTTLLDLVVKDGHCYGAVLRLSDGSLAKISAGITVLATGGIGGLFRFSTNYKHLTGDALAIALRHGVALKNLDYVQIHPTTLYNEIEDERSFLISESVRGEGAKLYGKDGSRFANELLPRDLLTKEIQKQMEKDQSPYVFEDLRPIPTEELKNHFPNILQHCLEMGYDVTKDCIPVVPAQHYFMGGIAVNHQSKTSMANLYAVGETACNGVHGRNRLASNSLLESLVFAKRAAMDIAENGIEFPLTDTDKKALFEAVDLSHYADQEALEASYKEAVLAAIQEAAEKTALREQTAEIL